MPNQRRSPPKTIPAAVFYGGTNGSGKSTLRGQYSDPTIQLHIDPDSIARHLNPNDPRSEDMAAGRKALEFFNLAVENREPFSLESTLTGKSILTRMQKSKDAGFLVELRYIGLDSADLNVERVAQRVAKGGHHIDEAVVRRRYEESRANLAAASKIADKVVIWDNSGSQARPCATIKNGVLEVEEGEPMPEWIQDVLQTVSPNLLKDQFDKLSGSPLSKGRFTDAVRQIDKDKGNDPEP